MLLGVFPVGGSFGFALLFGHRRQLDRTEVSHAVPAGEIFTVEQRCKAFRSLVVLLSVRKTRQYEK